MFPVHASISQQGRGGVWTVCAIAEARVILLIKALSGTAAEGIASQTASLAASRRAMCIGGRVDVGVVQGRRVVAVVQ